MANTVQLKRSGTASATPASLAHGELALNYSDGKVFWKDASNAIQSFTFQSYATAASPTFSGVVTVPAGTVGAPAIVSTTGTSDTGQWFPAADTIAWSTAGKEAMRIDSAQRVRVQQTATDGTGVGRVEWMNHAGTAKGFTVQYGDSYASGTYLGAGAGSFFIGNNSGPFSCGTVTADSVRIATNSTTRILVDSTGAVAIGGATATNAALYVRSTVDSANTRYGILSSPTIAAANTSSVYCIGSLPILEASAAIGSSMGYYAFNTSLGASATLTNQYGFYCAALTSATNNYAYYGGVASGTGRFNAYMAGTAANYFAGSVGIGTTGPTSPLHVVGTVDCDGLIIGTTTASATGISVLGAADAAAARTTISAAAATHTHDASDITSGTIATARLGSGTADATTYLRGDGSWATPASSSSVVSAASPSGFPGTGASNTLYLATDTGRIYHYVSGTGYVEAGPVGGGDTALWSLFLPPAPTSVSGTAGNAQVSLTWTAPTVAAQTPITDYVVQYSSNSGSTWTTFADGTSTAASATVTGLTNSTAYTFRVAAVNAVGQGAWSTASASVTPAVATDAYFSSVSLLLHCDGSGSTFTDSSAYGAAITAYGNATQSATQSKWGGKSLYMDGSGDYLQLADSANYGFGTGDFCVEYWHYPIQNSGNETLLDMRTSDAAEWLVLGKSSTGAVRTYDGSSIRTGGAMNLNAWNHVAWSRTSGDNAVYLNGTRVLNWTNAASVGSTRRLTIGSNVLTSAENSYGYLDDLRVTKGTNRGYTGASITVPTAAFPDS